MIYNNNNNPTIIEFLRQQVNAQMQSLKEQEEASNGSMVVLVTIAFVRSSETNQIQH